MLCFLGVTTWEQSSRPGPPAPAGRPPGRLVALAAGSLAVVSLAWGSYRVLLAGARSGAFTPPAARQAAGPLEPSSMARRALLRTGRSPVASTAPARSPAARPAYVVSVATFASRERAEAHARRVRSKGYLAAVVRDGASYRVLTRPYPSEEAARRAARVLSEIGFSARVVVLRHTLPAPRDENGRIMILT